MRKLDYQKAIFNLAPPPIRQATRLGGYNEADYNAWVWNDPRGKPSWTTIEEEACRMVRNEIADELNAVTDARIRYGFVYNAQRVRLCPEDQFNFKSGCETAKNYPTYLPLPTQVKVWRTEHAEPVLLTIDTIEDFEVFYFGGLEHVQLMLGEGFALKTALKDMTAIELRQYKDARAVPSAG